MSTVFWSARAITMRKWWNSCWRVGRYGKKEGGENAPRTSSGYFRRISTTSKRCSPTRRPKQSTISNSVSSSLKRIGWFTICKYTPKLTNYKSFHWLPWPSPSTLMMSIVSTTSNSSLHSSSKMTPGKWIPPSVKTASWLTILSTTSNHIWLGKTQTSRRKSTFYPDQSITTLIIQEVKIQVTYGCWSLLDWIGGEGLKYSIHWNSWRLF